MNQGATPTMAARAEFAALGTTVQLSVIAPEPHSVLLAAQALIAALEHELSRFTTGALATLNSTDGAWVEVNSAVDTVLHQAQAAYHATGGVFDVTAGCHNALQPHPDQPQTWRLLHQAQVDLGGIAKGYIADQTRDLCARMGATGALVNLGSSSIAVLGSRADGTPWQVGLRNPGGPRTAAFGVVPLTSGALSTSSLDERPGHIAHPKAQQVSVIAVDGITAEVWSTALLILGPDGLFRNHRHGLFEALVVTPQTIIHSPGFPLQQLPPVVVA